jgi:hypothetical protein
MCGGQEIAGINTATLIKTRNLTREGPRWDGVLKNVMNYKNR